MAIIGIPQRRSSYFLTLGVVWPPFLSIEDEHCCLGLASVSLALLDSFQRIPYGTLAWKQSYGRRNIVEKSNAMLKDKGALKAGSVPGLWPRRSNHRCPGRSPQPKGSGSLVRL